MASHQEKIQKTIDAFTARCGEAFGDSLVSVILHGAAVRGDMTNDTHLTFMVTLTDNTPSELVRVSGDIHKWEKQHIAVPLFVTREYIERSLDTFPLEFMTMKAAYRVVRGEDVLEGVAFERGDVRSQCEREIKGKLLHLRAEYLSLRGDKKKLADLVSRSLATFRLLFTGALYLAEREAAGTMPALLDAVTEAYGLDESLFRELQAFAGRTKDYSGESADRLFDRYVEELDSLAEKIDALN